MDRISELQAGAAALLREAERIASLPSEPITDADGYSVVFFRKQFKPYGIVYTYSAALVPHLGLWYVSGSRSFSQGTTWDKLIEWITNGSSWELWQCDRWELMANSE